MKKTFYLMIGLTVFVLAAGVGYWSVLSSKNEKIVQPVVHNTEIVNAFQKKFRVMEQVTPPKPVPDITFSSPQDARTSFDDLKSPYVLVNFWATWCAPCVVELPSLEALSKKYQDRGLQVIAISVDIHKRSQTVRRFLKDRKIGLFAGYTDPEGNIRQNIPMRGIPTSVLLDPNRNILYIFEGDTNWTSPESIAFFDHVLIARQ